MAGRVDWPNQSYNVHVHVAPFKILKILILKNFPIKPRILPHIHKKVLLKSINVLIAESITLIRLRFAFPQAVGSDCILLNMTLEMQSCQ